MTLIIIKESLSKRNSFPTKKVTKNAIVKKKEKNLQEKGNNVKRYKKEMKQKIIKRREEERKYTIQFFFNSGKLKRTLSWGQLMYLFL